MSDRELDIERFLAEHGPFEKTPMFRDGDKIGDWRVTAFLGRGATSEVYRAENAVTRQIGAVKVFMRGDNSALERFRREVALLAQMDCAALPRFYGAGAYDGRTFLATELLEHADMPSKDADVARFILGVCAGVGALHAHGYVHRDIKPRNVMRRPSTGEPILIDMGLAKETDESPHAVSDTLSIVDGHAVGVGTVGYSAPEQFAGGKVGVAADVHALGMLANTCFKSHPPRVWTEIIRRSTSSAPEQRYATVAAFVRAVRHRHWRRWAIASLFLLLLATALIVFIVQSPQSVVEEADDSKLGMAACPQASEPPCFVSAEIATNIFSLGSTNREKGANVTTIQLNGRDITISGETSLSKGQNIVIIGPGRLTASIFGERGASVELTKRAMLINLTTTPYPMSAMKYILTGEAYVNFKNLDRPHDGDINNIGTGSVSGLPLFDFRGPDTIDFEKAKAINDAAWAKAIESGSFW